MVNAVEALSTYAWEIFMLSRIMATPRERRAARELALSHVRLYDDAAEERLRETLTYMSWISSSRRITVMAIRRVRQIQKDPAKRAILLPVRSTPR
jgi:hypothetical protein